VSAGGQGGWIGRAVPRSEDLRFVTGRGRYVDDLDFPGMLHAVVVRSAHAHARLRGIDATAALALPGVAAVLTFADIAACAAPIPIRTGPLEGTERFLQRPLAEDRVRYVGEPVALVVARDRYAAEDAAERVAVEYDPLPAVVDAAVAERACHYRVGLGDVDAAFAAADYVRTETFRCQRHGAVPMETRGLVCREHEGRLEVWGATKVPFWNRRTLAAMLGRPVESIELIEVDVGGSFGARGEFYPEDLLIPLAALRLGRPVKWIEDRREHLMASNHSREMECELSVALARDGTLLGLRGRLVADMGAYTRTNSGVVPSKAAQFLLGPYRLRNFACEVELAMTNKTPVGTYRAPGRFEANFFRERLFDIACAELGIDRVAFREKNLIRPDELPWSIGKTVPYEPETEYDTGDYPGLFRRALAAFDYTGRMTRSGEARDGRLHGVGFGCFVESSGAGPAETARVVARGEDRFDLYTGTSSSGQGHETALAQILADTLGVPFAGITVHHGSTGLVPQGYGTFHSRAVVVGGSAVKLAGEKLAARLAQVPADEHPGLEAIATFEVSKRTYTHGVHLCEVAVDPETAQVEVVDYLSTEDVGRVVNPLIVHGQALGAAVQGLGGAFLDEFKYDAEGQLLTGSFADYLLPTATDFPNVAALTFEESPSLLNPLGAKGAGEGGIVAVGAAVGNAVAHALAPLGVEITAMPLSLDNLGRAIRAAREKRGA
jgi:carbon-monoxide dehydrogenase large subunit